MKPIIVGDLVIVVTEEMRKGWSRGRILEVIRGFYGRRVRQAIGMDIDDDNVGQSSSGPSSVR